MVNGLEQAYRQIKSYALKAAVSRVRERKIKEIFRQYVPEDVIRAVQADENKVSGDQDVLSVLFSHITNYEQVIASLRPDELVQTLEPYFRAMVETIEGRGGMVDKYITDAVMAFFGAPVKRDDDALRSVHRRHRHDGGHERVQRRVRLPGRTRSMSASASTGAW